MVRYRNRVLLLIDQLRQTFSDPQEGAALLKAIRTQAPGVFNALVAYAENRYTGQVAQAQAEVPPAATSLPSGTLDDVINDPNNG